MFIPSLSRSLQAVSRQTRISRSRAARFVPLLLILILSACGGDSGGGATTAPTSAIPAASATATAEPTSGAASPTDAGLPVNAAGVAIVARVNGVELLYPDYARTLSRIEQLSFAADPRALAQTVLDTLIEQVLIEQAAAALGVTVTDAEVDADLAAMVAQAGSEDAWNRWLADNQYTAAEYRAAARSQLITLRVRDAVLAQVQSAPDASGTASLSQVRQVHARHILVPTEAEAQDILTRLNNGEDFGTLAAQLSRDVTTKDRGGDLGFFIAENLTTPELAEVAFALQPGETAGPVQTALGYHIIQTIEFSTSAASPEDLALRQEAAFNAWLTDQKTAASIERFLQ